MIKRTISPPPARERSDPQWLQLAESAEIEISSESAAHPIEAALIDGDDRGWQADGAGAQTIRLVFPQPQPLKHVRVIFEEHERERTQQFVLRAAVPAEGHWRELVRQQFTFSPGGATREQEDYRFDLPAVASLELTIIPDISGGIASASLQQLRVA